MVEGTWLQNLWTPGPLKFPSDRQPTCCGPKRPSKEDDWPKNCQSPHPTNWKKNLNSNIPNYSNYTALYNKRDRHNIKYGIIMEHQILLWNIFCSNQIMPRSCHVKPLQLQAFHFWRNGRLRRTSPQRVPAAVWPRGPARARRANGWSRKHREIVEASDGGWNKVFLIVFVLICFKQMFGVKQSFCFCFEIFFSGCWIV